MNKKPLKKILTLDDYKDKTWYENTKFNYFIYIQKNNNKTYGFNLQTSAMEYNYSGTWNFKDNDFHIKGVYKEVTDMLVIEKLLVKEAEQRYGKDWRGVKLESCMLYGKGYYLNDGSYCGIFDGIYLWNKNGCIFNNGKWAEIKK